MNHDSRNSHTSSASTPSAGQVSGPGPGKATLVSAIPAAPAIQRRATGDASAAAGGPAPAPAASGAAPGGASAATGAGPAPATGGGEPLPAATRSKMEASFGAGFDDVRVHQGDHAARAGAEAYAQGTNLYFAPGKYAPGTPAGDELIGHELAHVVQQRAGRVAAPAQHKGGVNDDAGLEAEADTMGARAAAGDHAAMPGATAGASAAAGPIQRKITLGKPGTPTPERVVDLQQVDALVGEVLALNDAALVAAATKVNAGAPQAAIRDAVLVLYRNERKFDTLAKLVAAATERLAMIQHVSAVDWDADVGDVMIAHPERPVFFAAFKGLVDDAKIEALWTLTCQGVHYQKGLNAKDKKQDPNPHYLQLAAELDALLAIKAGDKPALWSGGYDVSMYAQGQGYRTLEVTAAGKIYDQLKLFRDFSTLGKLWDNISKKFVASFAGETHVFVRTMDKSSTLFRQELGEAVHLDGVHAMKWHVMKGADLATLSEIDGAGKPARGHSFDGYRAAATAMSADSFRAPAGKHAIAGEPATADDVHAKMTSEAKQVPVYVAQLKQFADQRAAALKLAGPANQPKVERLVQRAELRLKNDPALGVDLADLYAEIKDDLAKDLAHLARLAGTAPVSKL